LYVFIEKVDAMIKTPNMNVILDEEGRIVDFHCDLNDVEYIHDELLGKNWFDIFFDDVQDKAKAMKIFNGLLLAEEGRWETCENDISCKNSDHKFMIFHNQLITIDGVKHIRCIGIEYHDAFYKLDEELIA